MTDKIISQITDLAKENQDIDVVWLYGSRARNSHTQKSDYDLAIAFKTFIEDPLDSRLRPELLAVQWQQQLKQQISIIDINKAPLPLCFTVICDDSAFYINDKQRVWQEEKRIMSMWEIDYEYSRKKYG